MVGYATKATTAKKYLCFSPNFVSVSGTAGTFKLKDYVPTGFSYENDELRVINPNTCGNVNTIAYIYEDDGFGVTGWWDVNNTVEYNETEFVTGTGFMTSYNSTAEISNQGSGKVYDEAPSIDCRGNKYQMIPNPLPRRVQLKEIVATGFNYENDELRILDPGTCGISVSLAYLTEDDGFGVTGWWDVENTVDYNDEYVEVGDGFLLSSNGKNVQITFPKAIK